MVFFWRPLHFFGENFPFLSFLFCIIGFSFPCELNVWYIAEDDEEPEPVETEEHVKEGRTHRTYTKAQARQRYKKGRS